MLRSIYIVGLILLLSGVSRVEATNHQENWRSPLPKAICDKKGKKLYWGTIIDTANSHLSSSLPKGKFVVRFAELPYSKQPEEQRVVIGMQMMLDKCKSKEKKEPCCVTLRCTELSNLVFEHLTSKNYKSLQGVLALGDRYEGKLVVAFSEGLFDPIPQQKKGLNLLYSMVPTQRYVVSRKDGFFLPSDDTSHLQVIKKCRNFNGKKLLVYEDCKKNDNWNKIEILHWYHFIGGGEEIKQIFFDLDPYDKCQPGFQARIPFLLAKEVLPGNNVLLAKEVSLGKNVLLAKKNLEIPPMEGYVFSLHPISFKVHLLKKLNKINLYIDKKTPWEASAPHCFFETEMIQSKIFDKDLPAYLDWIRDIEDGDDYFNFQHVSHYDQFQKKNQGLERLLEENKLRTIARIFPIFGVLIPPHFFSIFSNNANFYRKVKPKRYKGWKRDTYSGNDGLTCDDDLEDTPKHFLEPVIMKEENGKIEFLTLKNGKWYSFYGVQHLLFDFHKSENQAMILGERLLVKGQYTLSMVCYPGGEKEICKQFLVSCEHQKLPFTKDDLEIIDQFDEKRNKNLKVLGII